MNLHWIKDRAIPLRPKRIFKYVQTPHIIYVYGQLDSVELELSLALFKKERGPQLLM